MEPRSRRVAAADGLELHVLEWSESDVALVLLHGFGNEAHIWDDFAPVVSPYYRTLAIDLRGHGDSDHDPERRYDYATHVRDLESLIANLGLDRLVLVGHSLGGRIATLFAAAHPERMAGLVLVDTGPELDPRGTSRIRQDAERQGDGSFASVADYERALAHAYPAATPDALRRMARHGVRRLPDGRFVRKMDPVFTTGRAGLSAQEQAEAEGATTRSLWEALGKIACPVLVVRGAASDVLSADVADRMVDAVLPDARLVVVPHSSHSVMTDNPDAFDAAVAAFVLGDD